MSKVMLFLLLVMGLAGIVLLPLYSDPPQGEEKDDTTEEGFNTPNDPKTLENRGYTDIYIWTEKKEFKVGEPIKLFIEEFLRDTHGAEIEEGLLSVENPLYHIGSLRIKLDGFGFLYLDSEEFPRNKDHFGAEYPFRGDYVPKEEEIDKEKLHGNLKILKWDDGCWEVDIKKGDCYVVKINDIGALWRRGWEVAGGGKMNEVGKYKIQYAWSNIIEIEVK